MSSVARVTRLGVAVGAAAVLVAASATGAQAATGQILYFNSAGDFAITNPPDGVCLTLQGPAQLVSNKTNKTNKTVEVFFTAVCTSRVAVLAPGRAVSGQGGPRSVRVIP
ncbi:hypothetical protein OG399_30870 [Streptomyces achromogenes]|uniref:Uncharacterized protein n=1 Tax=Streptomyces achromogenes TaxID=67255 RepID=A0ABZ1KHI2_STRAH